MCDEKDLFLSENLHSIYIRALRIAKFQSVTAFTKAD